MPTHISIYVKPFCTAYPDGFLHQTIIILRTDKFLQKVPHKCYSPNVNYL